MASLPHSKTVTYEEWLRMPEVKGEEVVSGEIAKCPRRTGITAKSCRTSTTRSDRRWTSVTSRWSITPFDLIIRRTPLTARQPDLAVFRTGTIVERDGRIHSAPQLVVEVPLAVEHCGGMRAEKLADYAAMGVPGSLGLFSR